MYCVHIHIVYIYTLYRFIYTHIFRYIYIYICMLYLPYIFGTSPWMFSEISISRGAELWVPASCSNWTTSRVKPRWSDQPTNSKMMEVPFLEPKKKGGKVLGRFCFSMFLVNYWENCRSLGGPKKPKTYIFLEVQLCSWQKVIRTPRVLALDKWLEA